MTSPDAYDSAAPKGGGPVYTRVYLAGGKYAHLRELATSCPSLQRTLTTSAEWYGTGSQQEHDRAAAKPLCPDCFALRETRAPDPRLGAGHGQEETCRASQP